MERESEQTLVQGFTGPPPGTVLLDKYRVDWTLGMGGFGVVLRAQHLSLDEPVAIKVLRDDAEDRESRERFLREAQAVVKLKSQHVARVLDVGLLDTGSPYMVMELLEGEDLGKLVGTPVPARAAVDYVLQACDALAEAHALGIVHRDVKPTNLFVAKRNDGTQLVKVLDFGISKGPVSSTELKLTQTASVLGTPAYMSPEQMRSARDVDARTDVWSLGCVLYELLEGALPFMAENFAELCVVVATQPPRAMMRAPRELERVLQRCFAKSPEERYANIGELAAALAPFATPSLAHTYVGRIQRVLAHVETPRPRRAAIATGVRAQPRNRAKWIALALVGVAVAMFAVVALTRPSDDAKPAAPPPPPAAMQPVVQPPAPPPAPPPPPPPQQQAVAPPPPHAPPRPANPPIAKAPVHAPPPHHATTPPPPANPPPPHAPCDPYKTVGGC